MAAARPAVAGGTAIHTSGRPVALLAGEGFDELHLLVEVLELPLRRRASHAATSATKKESGFPVSRAIATSIS
jgi:hypothetical protein